MVRGVNPPSFENKIHDPAALERWIGALPRPLVFTNGVFDLLHRGHVTYLARARALGIDEREVERRMAEANSIKHLVDSAEVADVVAFLASLRSIAINGESIGAGGGAPRSIHY